MGKTAIIIGATGLIGSHLTRLLLENDDYGRIEIFVRRSSGIDDVKLEEHVVDFDRIAAWQDLLTGDELFSAMGTTRKQAGSKEAQYRVDFTYQYETARTAARNGVARYFLVSSAGADPGSRFFYPRIKGELEVAVSKLPFQGIAIFRPSILVGARRERRPGEEWGAALARVVTRLVPGLRRYRPIPAETVARAMVESARRGSGRVTEVYELDEIFDVGESR